MTSLAIEFSRSDGKLLRAIDAGFEFIDSNGMPLSNVERPIRIEAESTHRFATIPLPDGLQTAIQIAAKDVPIAGEPLTVKTHVEIAGVNYELIVSVTSQLNEIKRDIPQPVPASPGPPSLKCPRPDCRGNLRLVRFRLGAGYNEFLGCSAFPACDYKRSLNAR